MNTSDIPVGARPENIGKVVSVQVFARDKDNPGSIVTDSMVKYVGILGAYFIGKNMFQLSFQNVPIDAQLSWDIKKKHVEIIPVDLLQ